MRPNDLLCSRNARPQKALVGRAQWKINQPPSPKKQRASLEGWGRSRQTVLRARRTRTMRPCSSNARTKGQPGEDVECGVKR